MSNEKTTTQSSSQAKMVIGSAWMTAGSIISRLLGAIYVVPWYAMLGEHGRTANALFAKGYNIYALFLMISTAGIPSAIAKQIAHYNSLNEYKVSKRLFRQSLIVMSILGVVCAALMFLLAPVLSQGDPDLIPTMRSLSVAVLIFPCISVIRGFFQGNQDMMPHAVSQVIEQVARVFYMLIATFIIMKVMKGDYVSAVTQSTFAAFIGMLAALAALFWYYKKQEPLFKELEAKSSDDVNISANQLIKEMIIEAIPFIIVGSGITFFRLVDQFTFEKIMATFSSYSSNELKNLFAVFSANPDKLTMIVISLATSLAATGLPLIAEAFTLKDKKSLSKLVADNFQLFFFVMIPATLGMIVLAYPLNTIFYEPDKLGSLVLIEACFAGLVSGYFMLVSTTLQGLDENKHAVRYLLIGLIIKLVLQYPAIRLFEVYGPLISTTIGFAVTCYLTTKEIREITKFNMSLTLRRILLICIFSLIMMVAALISKGVFGLFLSSEHKLSAFVLVLLVATVGIMVYGYLVLKVRLADRLLGQKVGRLRTRLHIK